MATTPANEYLDLAKQDPEEFEGKIVVYSGCEYRVGAYLGTGAEKIVHKLVNLKSGLTFLVIKIFRAGLSDERLADLLDIMDKLTSDRELARIITPSAYVHAHGGVLEIQPYLGSDFDPDPNVMQLLHRARTQQDSGDVRGAESIYKQVLAINPWHTFALTNLAGVQQMQGDVAAPYSSMSKVLATEPNLLLYQVLFVKACAAAGAVRDGLEQFERTRIQFPYRHDLDATAARLYIVRGDLQQVAGLLTGGHIDGEEATSIKRQLDEAEASARAAQRYVRQARALVQESRFDGVAELLEQALRIHRNDPATALNLALCSAERWRLEWRARVIPGVGANSTFGTRPFVLCERRVCGYRGRRHGRGSRPPLIYVERAQAEGERSRVGQPAGAPRPRHMG
jgi:tetratricopeptide (TPR) repeat protein